LASQLCSSLECGSKPLDSALVIPETVMRGGYLFRFPELTGTLKALFPD
jgi:hypothetical protein